MIGDFPIYIIIKLLLSFSFLIVLPGILLQMIALKERSIINLIGGSFLFGFLLFIPMSFISYLCHFPLYSIIIVQVLILLILILLNKKSFKKKKISVHKKHFFFLLVVGLLSGLLSMVMGWFPRGDASVHLQVIRNLVGDFVINQPHYSLLGQEKIPDHIYDAYYILLASVQYVTKIELTILWHYSSAVFSFFLPFSIYYLGYNLKRDNRFPVFLVFSFVFISITYNGIMYGTVYDALVYPNRFYLWLMMPVILGLTTNLLKDYSKTKLVICALSVVSFLFIHQSGFLFYFIIFGGVLLIVLIKKEYKLFRSILILFGLIIITSLPFLLIKLSGNIQFITSSSDQIWHNHYKFFYLTNDFFAFSYSKYFISEMWYGIIISLISLFYILIKKDHTDKFI